MQNPQNNETARTQATPHTVHTLSTECAKPCENSVQSAQLQLLHSVQSAQECTKGLSALSAECFWWSVFQAKCTVHESRPAVRTSKKVVQTREIRVGGGRKRCLNGLVRQWQVIMAKIHHFRWCLTFRQGAVSYSSVRTQIECSGVDSALSAECSQVL